jgi:hypothetical protein
MMQQLHIFGKNLLSLSSRSLMRCTCKRLTANVVAVEERKDPFCPTIRSEGSHNPDMSAECFAALLLMMMPGIR